MSRPPSPARRPYVVLELGRGGLAGDWRYERSAHTQIRLAVNAARELRRAWASLIGAQAPPVFWHIVDARDGRVCDIIR